MSDIFDAKIICKKCDVEMKLGIAERGGLQLRAVKCTSCGDTIIHPADLNNLNHYNNIRNKTFTVKLRMVGNSHAISIPKEIVEFMNEMQNAVQKHTSDMVRLGFEDFGRLSLKFMDEMGEEEEYGK
ncbi:MAG: hypothetical protein Q7S74_06860 [Nanoarchaeota archaeon]|nr:hypothetical protein [Nanoarchaeota archaeon]